MYVVHIKAISILPKSKSNPTVDYPEGGRFPVCSAIVKSHNEVQNLVQGNKLKIKYIFEKNKSLKHPNNKINRLHYYKYCTDLTLLYNHVFKTLASAHGICITSYIQL